MSDENHNGTVHSIHQRTSVHDERRWTPTVVIARSDATTANDMAWIAIEEAVCFYDDRLDHRWDARHDPHGIIDAEGNVVMTPAEWAASIDTTEGLPDSLHEDTHTRADLERDAPFELGVVQWCTGLKREQAADLILTEIEDVKAGRRPLIGY